MALKRIDSFLSKEELDPCAVERESEISTSFHIDVLQK